jgi:hypothetical protein
VIEIPGILVIISRLKRNKKQNDRYENRILKIYECELLLGIFLLLIINQEYARNKIDN